MNYDGSGSETLKPMGIGKVGKEGDPVRCATATPTMKLHRHPRFAARILAAISTALVVGCTAEPRVELTSDSGALSLAYGCTETGPRSLHEGTADLVRNVVARENADHILATTNPNAFTPAADAVRTALARSDLNELELAVAGFVCSHGHPPTRPPRFLEPGSAPRDFTLVPLDGENAQIQDLRLSDLRGRTVVVVFWSTYCKACRDEYEVLQQIARRGTAEPISVYAILHADTESNLEAWFEKHGTGVDFVRDDRERIARDYLVYGIPYTVVVRPDGLIHVAGHVFPADLEREVDEAMRFGAG